LLWPIHLYSSVGIATGYGLDGPGIESRWGRDFPHLSRPDLGAHPASCTMGTGFFPGVKSGRGLIMTPHPLLVPLVMKEYSYTSTPLMGYTACTEPQCLYKGDLYLYLTYIYMNVRHQTLKHCGKYTFPYEKCLIFINVYLLVFYSFLFCLKTLTRWVSFQTFFSVEYQISFHSYPEENLTTKTERELVAHRAWSIIVNNRTKFPAIFRRIF